MRDLTHVRTARAVLLALAGGDLSVVRDGDDYVLTGAAPDTRGSGLGDLSEDATMTLSVTFPGAVAEANGAVEGAVVTWDLTDAPATLEARGAASADTGVPGWIVVSVGLAVGIAAGVILVLVTKRRARRPGAAKPQATESA